MKYDYRCRDCGIDFEYERDVNEPDPTCCPVCEGNHIVRIFTAANTIFKGKGFYSTDKRS